jgi:hypothetical protein
MNLQVLRPKHCSLAKGFATLLLTLTCAKVSGEFFFPVNWLYRNILKG